MNVTARADPQAERSHERAYLRAMQVLWECQDALVEAEGAVADTKTRIPVWRRYELLKTRGRGMS